MYSENISEAAITLREMRENLFREIFFIVMSGEMKEWNDSVKIGESFEFDKRLFEACDDYNVQLLTRLLTEIENTYDSLVNINNLKLNNDD